MPKFFSPESDLNQELILLSGENAEHLRVLRVREGEELTVSDGRGLDARCIVEHAEREAYQLRVLKTEASRGEAAVKAYIYAALPKGDKAEVIVQKSVELGAAAVIFFPSSRCVSRPDEKAIKGKLSRLQKVAASAAMQSFRGLIPPVRWLPGFKEMLAEAGESELAAFLWEEENARSLGSLMKARGSFRSAALITGPEGGFSEEEAVQAASAGIPAVTLGPRILRCETAPLCALTAVMYECGELT